jgi:hypothetical protein
VNCARLACAVITHNLPRAAAALAGGDATVARRATLRRDLVNIPAPFAAPACAPTHPLARQVESKNPVYNVIGYPAIQHRAA